MDDDPLLDRLGRDPDDEAVRAAYLDALRRRGHPGARFLELDEALLATPRAATRFAELDEARHEAAAALDPAWIIRVGERDAARFELVADDLHRLCACLHGGDSTTLGFALGPHQVLSERRHREPLGEPVILERGLRAADVEALAEAFLPAVRPELQQIATTGHLSLRSRPDPRARVLVGLRWLLPQPWRWLIDQPPFTQSWATRAPTGQRIPQEPNDEVDVFLIDAGSKRREIMLALRKHDPSLTLHDVRAMVSGLPRLLAQRVSRDSWLVEELRALDAVVECRYPDARGRAKAEPVFEPRGFDDITLESGDPGLVVLQAVGDALFLFDYEISWPHPHIPVPTHRRVETWPLAAFAHPAPAELVALRTRIEATIAARRALFITCRLCGKETPPELAYGADTCSGCAERHLGVVH